MVDCIGRNARQQQVLIYGGFAALGVHAYRFNSFSSPGISADKVHISPQRLSRVIIVSIVICGLIIAGFYLIAG